MSIAKTTCDSISFLLVLSTFLSFEGHKSVNFTLLKSSGFQTRKNRVCSGQLAHIEELDGLEAQFEQKL